MNRPVAICVGTTKAGTSWLYKCLEEHPEINASRGKETNFFASGVVQCENFFTYFDTPSKVSLYFESSPKYFSDPVAIKAIHKCFPDAKIIVMLREPIERTKSHIRHMCSIGRYNYGIKLDDAIEKTPTVLADSLYSVYLPIITNLFPRDQILILDYKLVCSEPQKLIDNTCSFLNIHSFSPKFLNVKYNSSAARSHPWYWKITMFYVRIRNYRLGRLVTKVWRRIGLNSGRLEKLLSIGHKSRATSVNLKGSKYLTQLQLETEYYNDLFNPKKP